MKAKCVVCLTQHEQLAHFFDSASLSFGMCVPCARSLRRELPLRCEWCCERYAVKGAEYCSKCQAIVDERRAKAQVTQPCAFCHGAGEINREDFSGICDECTTCGGTGRRVIGSQG